MCSTSVWTVGFLDCYAGCFWSQLSPGTVEWEWSPEFDRYASNISLVLWRNMKCMVVTDNYIVINNDLALEKNVFFLMQFEYRL